MENNKQYNEAKKFLTALSQGNDAEVFHFQTFDDLKDSKRSSLIRVLVGTLEEHFDQLIELNNKGAGIFVCVNKIENSLRREAKSVTKVRAVFADKDDGNFDRFPVEPSLLIQTKNGQHAYWITNEVSRDGFAELQKQLINTLKTDISIHDLPRVMRLPGFFHRKDPNNIFFVTVLKENNAQYSLNDLMEAFPKALQKEKSAKVEKGSHTEISKYIEKTDGAIQGEGGDLVTFQVACSLVRGFNLSTEDALEYFRKFNEKCKPMWSEAELVQKLESARKSGSGDFGYLLKNITTEQWVHKFVEKNNVKTTYNQKIIFNGETIPASSLVRRAEIQWDNEGRKSKIGIIKSIFEEWESNSRKDILKRVKEQFKFNPNLKFGTGQDPISCFTRALVGENCENFEQHKAVISHFVWQVKRKLFGYQVVHHMCPVLVGKQGSGKTQALENLIRPLAFLSMEANLGTFVRESERFVFGTYYIVKLDEFARGTKSDVESMKHIITSADINYRTFYVQKMASMPNVATFIGASNRSVADIFNDSTGNRRFYEIPCLDKVDWKEIGGFDENHGIDYFSLWRSVDEESESPILPLISEINKYQEEFRSKTIVEEWLASEDLKPEKSDKTELVALKKLHLDFMNWMRIQNCNYSYTDQRFGRDLSKLLEHRKRNDGSHYFIKSKTVILKEVGLQFMKPDSPPGVVESKDTQLDRDIDDFLANAANVKIDLNRYRK